MSYLVVLTTASSRKEALKLADLILSKRLAACVNILPVMDSLYWWKGKKEKGREVQMFIKTRAAAFKPLEALIRKNHSYSVPEILALPAVKGSKAYLGWISREVRPFSN